MSTTNRPHPTPASGGAQRRNIAQVRRGVVNADVVGLLAVVVGLLALGGLLAGVLLGDPAAGPMLPALAWTGTIAGDPVLIAVLAAIGLVCLFVLAQRLIGRGMASARVLGAIRARAAGERDPEALRCTAATTGSAPDVAAWNAVVDELLTLERAPSERRRGSGAAPTSGERRLGPMCQAHPDGLLLVGQGGVIRYANGAAGFLLGRPVGDLAGVDVDDVIESDAVREAVVAASGGESRHAAPVDLRRGETAAQGVLRFIVRPIRDESSREAVVIIQDVTQQHVAAASRESFVAHVAHELRTPLTNILLWAQTATERGGDDQRMVEQALNIITTESRRLERVVQDMLSISEIESGRQSLSLSDVDVANLLKELEGDFGPQAKEKQLTLEMDLPPKALSISADRDKLGVALHNLVGNAIKYTPAGGRVSVRAAESEDGEVQVDVTDTGIGIGPEDLVRIFERFQRAEDERIAGITGSGLGLAIARDLARLHGGDIEAASQPDEGSVFTLRLPRRSAA